MLSAEGKSMRASVMTVAVAATLLPERSALARVADAGSQRSAPARGSRAVRRSSRTRRVGLCQGMPL